MYASLELRNWEEDAVLPNWIQKEQSISPLFAETKAMLPAVLVAQQRDRGVS